MRWLIWYIRSCFCKHDFKFEETISKERYFSGTIREGIKVATTCKKCGWHESYWKF